MTLASPAGETASPPWKTCRPADSRSTTTRAFGSCRMMGLVVEPFSYCRSRCIGFTAPQRPARLAQLPRSATWRTTLAATAWALGARSCQSRTRQHRTYLVPRTVKSPAAQESTLPALFT